MTPTSTSTTFYFPKGSTISPIKEPQSDKVIAECDACGEVYNDFKGVSMRQIYVCRDCIEKAVALLKDA